MSDSAENSFDERSRIVLLATQPVFQVILAVIALIVIILFGSFVYLYYPYSGMEISWDTNFGQVSAIYPDGPADQAGVQEGDRLLSIDGKPLTQRNNGPAYRFGIRSGDTVVFEFQRGQEIIDIPIIIGGYFEDWNWFWYSFLIHFLAISFWAMGAALCIFSPHKDERSRLLGLGFLVAGMIAAVGLAGGWNSFWGANSLGIILRIWLGPIYIAAHLTFPAISFQKYRRSIINVFVIIAIILTLLILISAWMDTPGELTISTSNTLDLRRLAQVFFFLSWFIGTGLLVYNRIYSQDMEVKRQTGVVIWGNMLGFSPYFVFVVLPYVLFRETSVVNLGALIFLLFVPLSYIYVIYQHKLLRVDFVINRFLVLFVLVLLVFSVSILVLGAFALVFDLSPDLPFVGGVVAALIVLPSAALQQNVQVRVNRVLYGNYYDFSTVTAGFSSRLAIALDRDTLSELLTKDLSTQMGIQQSALLLVDWKKLVLQSGDADPFSIPLNDDICNFLLDAGNPIRSQYLWGRFSKVNHQHWRELDWGELYVPMVFEGMIQGILVLGERVAGDIYSDTDLQIIATIAYQGALAFANVQLVETLRGLTRRLVRADENQRRKVARDLHDTVLQDLFFVKQQLSSEQKEIADHVSNIISRLRKTIKAQRTTLLDQGIELALESLVVDMQSLTGENTRILWNNSVKQKLDLTDEQATSIYRIVQEAISNALKHAQAAYIDVKIHQKPDDILVVTVDDDGVGLPESEWGTANEHHYGVLGMKERALMVGAELNIVSNIGEGTTVTLEMQL